METTGAERGGIFRVLGGSGGIVHQGDTSQTLRSVSGSLWETVFTREEQTVDLGEGISFVLDERRLARVHNGTSNELHGAFIVDAAGTVYVIGDVAAGATVDIPRDGALFLPASSGYYDVSSPDVGTLRDALGLARGEEAYALGIARLLGALPSGLLPVFYAQTTPDAAPTSSPSFAVERDLRIVRVVPNMPVPEVYLGTGTIAAVAPEPPPDPLGDALQGFFGTGQPEGASR
jgi:hypothetical protein